MTEHDADAVLNRIDALMWTEPYRKASKRERCKMIFAALKPGDWLIGRERRVVGWREVSPQPFVFDEED